MPFHSPLKMSAFNNPNQEQYENLLGSEIYCVSGGSVSPTSVLVILITWSTTKSFWIICHSLGHMRAILCKRTQHALRHMDIIHSFPKIQSSKPIFNTKKLRRKRYFTIENGCFSYNRMLPNSRKPKWTAITWIMGKEVSCRGINTGWCTLETQPWLPALGRRRRKQEQGCLGQPLFTEKQSSKKKKKREKTRIQPTSADQRKFPHTFNKRPKRPFMSNEKFPQHVLLITRNENRMKRRNSQFRIFFGHGSECKHEAPVGTQKGTVSNRWHGATSCRFSTQMRQGRSIHFTTARLKRKFF